MFSKICQLYRLSLNTLVLQKKLKEIRTEEEEWHYQKFKSQKSLNTIL